ncbi:MAG: gamma-glutamyltransferase [Mariprofundus sp.]|nr:gamma-glutamyltransferase [Mariprofundus sp.]
MSSSLHKTRESPGTVAAGHPATAEAAIATLRMGGNAVDAAIAAQITAFIAEPVLTSAGGGGFMLVAGKHLKPTLYDGFPRMPYGQVIAGIKAKLKAVEIDFGDKLQTFHIGQGSVAAPSLLAMLFMAHRQHGKLPLSEVMAPGIDAARSGIRLNALQGSLIELLRPILTDSSSSMTLHAPSGKLRQEGDNFCNRALANTLEMLHIEGIDEMYHGDLARAIVRSCTPYGLLSMDDMSAEQVQVRKPLSIPLFSGTLLTNPPPSSGGLLIAYAAILLDQLQGKAELPLLLTESLHASSLLRHDHFDRDIYHHDIIAKTLDPAQIAQGCRAIIKRLHGETTEVPASETANRHGSTTHISVIDSHGLAVSLTSSNGEGSAIVVPESGIHLNNMLGEADINPLGLHQLSAGSSLSSMMAPSIFTKAGKPTLVLGSGGSNRLRGAILQVLTQHLLQGKEIEPAIAAPRLHNEGQSVDCEPGALNQQQHEQLRSMGWSINQWQQKNLYFGGVHGIAIDCHGHIQAAGDPRRGGVALTA